jgi:hypothetical protein
MATPAKTDSSEKVIPEQGKASVESKAYSDDGMDISKMVGFECSMRTKAIDYAAIVKTSINLMGPTMSIAWASKFNLHGQKVKPGQFVAVGGEKMTVERFSEVLATQVGWAIYKESRFAGTQKISNKDLVTVGRLCKAFAKSTISMIRKGYDAPEDDTKGIAESSGLPLHFAFICSPYGMTNEEIIKYDEALEKFFNGFDSVIKTAKTEGWVEGSKVRSHAKEYANLKSFRGIKVAAKV